LFAKVAYADEFVNLQSEIAEILKFLPFIQAHPHLTMKLSLKYYIPGFLIAFFISISGFAQTELYFEDFEDTNSGFEGFVLSNLDKGIPYNTDLTSLQDSAWIIRSISGMNTHAALGTSSYNPVVAANDWFITPAIRLGKASRLEWDALSLMAQYPENYDVFISTTDQTVNSCLLNFSVYDVIAEQSGSFKHHTFELSGTAYSEKTVYVGFRLKTTAGKFLAIDNIKVMDDSIQSLVTLNFNVDMSAYISAGNFNPKTDTVDIAGNFNNWNGESSILSIVLDSDSSKYAIYIPGFRDGDVLEFKFRINSSWNDTSIEFPYQGTNRIWTVTHGLYSYSARYNEAGTVSGIGELDERLADFTIYPNPASKWIRASIPVAYSRILLTSSSGVMLREWTNPGKEFYADISNLSPGLYQLLIFDHAKLKDSRKFIKN
jgi:hypothetical protein